MPITANITNEQITASVGETQIDVSVSGGIGPAGPTGAAGSSYTLPTATASVLGGVKVNGNGVSIDGNGVLSVSTNYAAASHTHAGSDVSYAPLGVATSAATVQLALEDIENAIETRVGSGQYASTNDFGIVKVGGGISVTDGVISVSTNYAAASHTHAISDVTDLASTLSGKAAASHAHSATSDLTFAGATAGQVLTVNSGATSLTWSTPFSGAYNDLTGKPTLGTAAALNTGTTAGTVATGDHTHTQLHDRSHAITSSSDHTATAWRAFYSNGSGVITELALGASGTVLTSGGASAAPSFAALPAGGTKTLARFTPEMNQPPSSNFATFDTRNSILVLEFDAATQESAVFCGVIPESSAFASGLIVRIWWMGDTATSGNVRWGVSFEKTGTDNDSDSFDTVTQAHSAASSTSGIETVTSITATAIDSLAAGDRFRLKVTRIADDATNDTMTGDAQLVAVEVQAA